MGSLLYVVKHSKIELSNAVCEISKYMYKANIRSIQGSYMCNKLSIWYKILLQPDEILSYYNSSSIRFRYFSLTFVMDHFKRLHFRCGIFRTVYPIKVLYGINNTHDLWNPVTDYSGINLAAWQSMYFLAHIPSILFLRLKWVFGPFYLLFPWFSLTLPTVWVILIISIYSYLHLCPS